ncbi:alpha/beta hydrolase [Poritiphilus flavus]|uniref:Phospholipase n=1 Tax=Poritiphilus flavus TaxID=2697053 RepID=A0A6L9EFE4_9FLAO|nr:phospholipase [Poritiphilus flavus]NAS13500.1 phospholipase [Poritiphilus flavus]
MTTPPLSLHHIVRPSSLKDTPAPAIFLFHGYGSNEEDLFSFASELPEKLYVISARAPFSLQPFGYAWYAINFDAEYGKWTDVEQAIISRDIILRFMDEACEAYDLDKANLSLLGFSQGTVLSYAVALSFPEKIKYLIALSGYIDEKILVDGYRDKDHSKLDVYASHGQVDMVIPPEWAQRAPELMKSIGISHRYEEFPVGHGVSPHNFQAFKRWLEARV